MKGEGNEAGVTRSGIVALKSITSPTYAFVLQPQISSEDIECLLGPYRSCLSRSCSLILRGHHETDCTSTGLAIDQVVERGSVPFDPLVLSLVDFFDLQFPARSCSISAQPCQIALDNSTRSCTVVEI